LDIDLEVDEKRNKEPGDDQKQFHWPKDEGPTGRISEYGDFGDNSV
jgi:hypothetical protein